MAGFAPNVQENRAASAGDDRVAIVVKHGNKVVEGVCTAQGFSARAICFYELIVVCVVWVVAPRIMQLDRVSVMHEGSVWAEIHFIDPPGSNRRYIITFADLLCNASPANRAG